MSTEKGIKLDDNKPRLDLVLGDFTTALWGVGLVGTFGANKYTDRGWHEVDNALERYSSALLRHYLNYKSGEVDDIESGLPHLAHLAWNALAILQLYMEQRNKCRCAGTIEEVNSTHTDFKPITREVPNPYCVGTMGNGKCSGICTYKYDCDYKEE